MRDWYLVAAGLAAVLLFLLGWSGVSWLARDPSGICQLIALLFAAGIALSWRAARDLQNEWSALEQQAPRLLEATSVRGFAEANADSLFGRHVGNLLHVFCLDRQVEQDRLLQLLEARLMARLRPTSLIGGLLITLGLIGTVVGLIQLIGGMGGLVSGEGAEAMVRGVQTVLQGMGTAFYTTLLGAAFGGVVLRILNALVEAASERYVADLAECMEVRVLPAMRQVARRRDADREADEAEALTDALRKLEEAFTTARRGREEVLDVA